MIRLSDLSCRSFTVMVSIALVISSSPGAFAQSYDQNGVEILPTQRNPGMFTTPRGPVFRGSHPARIPLTRGGIWDEEKILWYTKLQASSLGLGDIYAWAGGLGGGLVLRSVAAALSGPGIVGEGTFSPGSYGRGGTGSGTSGGGDDAGETGGGGTGTGVGPGNNSIGNGVIGGESNTLTGNHLTTVPIIGWRSKGQSYVNLTLYHSTFSAVNGALGLGWTTSYDAKVRYDIGTPFAYVEWGNGLILPYQVSGSNFLRPAGIHDSLTRNTNGTWTVVTKHQQTYDFDTSGNLVTVKDRDNNSIIVHRNTAGKITSIEDPATPSRSITFDYNAAGLVDSITDPRGEEWLLSYDSSPNLTRIDYPMVSGVDSHREFWYDTSDRLISEVDRRGKVWEYSYDVDGRIWTVLSPLGNPTSYEYNLTSTVVTLPGFQTITDNYSSGLLASRQDEGGYSSAYLYDSDRNVTQVTDKHGKFWTRTFDGNGNVLTVTDPLLHVKTYTYSTANDLLTFKNGLNKTWTLGRDSVGHLLTVTDPLTHVSVTNTYDAVGQLETTRDALNPVTTYGRDTHGNVTQVTAQDGTITTLTYGTLGNVESVTSSAAVYTEIDYDEWLRPTTVTEGTAVFSTTYDLEDAVLTSTDALNHTSIYTYSDDHQCLTFQNARGDTETYVYNENGWLTSVQNGRLKTRTYEHSPRGEVTLLTLPDSSTEQWSYNGNGQTTAYTNAMPHTIQYVYDDAGRLEKVDYTAGIDTQFTYDEADRRTIMADRTGSTVWGYDVANRLTSLTTPQGATTYTYNNADQRLTMVEAGVGTTTYDYDTYGRPEWVQNPFAETTSWLYDPAGRTSRQTLSSGVYEQYGYDGHSRLNAITVKNSGGTVIESQVLTYDDSSNLAVRTHNGVATNYTYDEIDQLLTETRPGYAGTYTYDANGNRLTKTINGIGTSYGYDDADKLTGYVCNGLNTSYTYDAAGRPIYISGSSPKMLYWSYESELSPVYFASGNPPYQSNLFSYNGLSTRVSARNRQNVTTTFMRDGAGVTDDVISDTNASYTPGISERRGGVTTFQHSGIKNNDAQSVVAQTVSATREYDAFGNVASSAGTFSGPFGYGGSFGYQSDSETGYKLLGYRYYDPETGRFLTRDRVQAGRNWYAYCDNNPLTYADPSGLDWHDPMVVTVSPGFKGKVTVVGEPGRGKGQIEVIVSPGFHSDPGMDVDYIIVEHPDGRTETLFLMGTGYLNPGDPNEYAYVDENGNITCPGILVPNYGGWMDGSLAGARKRICPPSAMPKPGQLPGGPPDKPHSLPNVNPVRGYPHLIY